MFLSLPCTLTPRRRRHLPLDRLNLDLDLVEQKQAPLGAEKKQTFAYGINKLSKRDKDQAEAKRKKEEEERYVAAHSLPQGKKSSSPLPLPSIFTGKLP